jgi:hypothetical protein
MYWFQKFFKRPSVHAIALNELEEAQRCLLASQGAAKYHAKMSEYYQDTIIRLTNFLNKE